MSHMCVVPGVRRLARPYKPDQTRLDRRLDASCLPRATLHSAPRRRRAGRRGAAPRPNPRSRRSFVHTERQLTTHTHTLFIYGPARGTRRPARRGGQLECSRGRQEAPTVPTRSRLDLREMRGFCFQRERAQRRNEHLHARVLLPKGARHSQPASAASAIIACIERCRH